MTTSAAIEGAELGAGGLLWVTSSVPAMMIAIDASQPNMKAAPFRTPRLDARINRNGVSEIGSSAIARPITMRSRSIRRVDQSCLRTTLPGEA